jgi:hypothetical protein
MARASLFLMAALISGCAGCGDEHAARAQPPAPEQRAETGDAVAGQLQQDQQRWTQREVEQEHADRANGGRTP